MSTLRKISIFRRFSSGPWGAVVALLVLLIVCAVSNSDFRRTANLVNIMRQTSYSGLIALGMTFVIVAGGIDLSVGSMFAFCGVASVKLLEWLCGASLPSLPVAVFITASLAIGGLCGAINGSLVSVGHLPPFIATLGTYSVFRSISLYLADSGNISAKSESLGAFCKVSALALPLPVLVLLGSAVVLAVVLTKTVYGRHVIASGANDRVAAFAGINVGMVRFWTYVLIGCLAGISAALFMGRLGTISSSNAGLLYELDAIAAVVIGGAAMNGGRGSVLGTLAGVFVLGIISNVLDLWEINPSLQGTVKGLAILLSVLIQRKKQN